VVIASTWYSVNIISNPFVVAEEFYFTDLYVTSDFVGLYNTLFVRLNRMMSCCLFIESFVEVDDCEDGCDFHIILILNYFNLPITGWVVMV
jgi:hypothetical protein